MIEDQNFFFFLLKMSFFKVCVCYCQFHKESYSYKNDFDASFHWLVELMKISHLKTGTDEKKNRD